MMRFVHVHPLTLITTVIVLGACASSPGNSQPASSEIRPLAAHDGGISTAKPSAASPAATRGAAINDVRPNNEIRNAGDDARKAPEQTIPGAADTTREGRINVVKTVHGRAPQLTDQEGRNWLIEGEYIPELLRCGGLIVRVTGAIDVSDNVSPTFTVKTYEILWVDGRKPVVGVLTQDANKVLWIQRPEEAVEVDASKALTDALTKKLGCKIWAVGRLEEQKLATYKFGWLNCELDKTIKTDKEANPMKHVLPIAVAAVVAGSSGTVRGEDDPFAGGVDALAVASTDGSSSLRAKKKLTKIGDDMVIVRVASVDDSSFPQCTFTGLVTTGAKAQDKHFKLIGKGKTYRFRPALKMASGTVNLKDDVTQNNLGACYYAKNTNLVVRVSGADLNSKVFEASEIYVK